MNKFFVVLLAYEKAAEKWSKKALYEYDTKDEAIKNWNFAKLLRKISTY